MITFKPSIALYSICLLIFLIPINYVQLPGAASFEVYSKDKTPLNIPYDVWVGNVLELGRISPEQAWHDYDSRVGGKRLSYG